ncbi:MAG: HEAT repeat domain-containing protein [Balneolaceae bacterium]|nr:HEAT repeat domain-containing protein [Balneolaceae bacterium]
MNDKHEQLIADYLQGTLTDKQTNELESLIESGAIDFIDFKAIEHLHDELEVLPVPAPSPEMRNRFYEMLADEQEKQKQTSGFDFKEFIQKMLHQITGPKLAYAFVLLIIGGFIGSTIGNNNDQLEQLSGELESMRQMMMISMLEGPSASDRLRAVNISSQLAETDDRAIRALLFTLNNDPSENVRIQTIEALARWGNQDVVREGLIKSITRQESDLVIVALADVMVELGLQQAAGEFEKLKNERELTGSTQTKIDNTIAVLL